MVDTNRPVEDVKDLIRHLEMEVKWPATKEDILAANGNMKDVDGRTKFWLERELPAATYVDAVEVKKLMGIYV